MDKLIKENKLNKDLILKKLAINSENQNIILDEVGFNDALLDE